MNVKELRKLLEQLPDDTPITMYDFDGEHVLYKGVKIDELWYHPESPNGPFYEMQIEEKMLRKEVLNLKDES